MSHWDALRLTAAPPPRTAPPATRHEPAPPLSVEELARGLPAVSWEDVVATALGHLAPTLKRGG